MNFKKWFPRRTSLDRAALSGGRTLSRRSVLRGLAGAAQVTVALPLLECMVGRKARAADVLGADPPEPGSAASCLPEYFLEEFRTRVIMHTSVDNSAAVAVSKSDQSKMPKYLLKRFGT